MTDAQSAHRPGRVAGKVALITGAASGLGAATAKRLAAEGATVVLSDIDEARGETLAAALRDSGAVAEFHRLDVSNEAGWQQIIDRIDEQFGTLDVLVNNAGISQSEQPIIGQSLADWRLVMSINLDGVFLGMRAAAPLMARSGGGSVINLASVLGKTGLPNASAYCASKGGVTLLTKSAALEWAELGMRVNSVHPGFIDTPMVADVLHTAPDGNEKRVQLMAAHALGRFGEAREIADAILFLASDEASFMTGSELVVDGGYTAH